jgi:hypothetical protein
MRDMSLLEQRLLRAFLQTVYLTAGESWEETRRYVREVYLSDPGGCLPPEYADDMESLVRGIRDKFWNFTNAVAEVVGEDLSQAGAIDHPWMWHIIDPDWEDTTQYTLILTHHTLPAPVCLLLDARKAWSLQGYGTLRRLVREELVPMYRAARTAAARAGCFPEATVPTTPSR